ncbi:retrotransposon protein [Tanacetum coccineum]
MGDNAKQQICLASMMDNSMLWHRSLGHANMRLVQNLASNELVSEFDKMQFESFYEQHEMSYNLSGPFTSQSNEIVERTHRYSQTSKAYIVLNKETIRIEESLNVISDEIFLEPNSSPLVEDDRINEPLVQEPVRPPSLEANASELGYPKSVKEAIDHLVEQVIGELNEKTLRSKTKQA